MLTTWLRRAWRGLVAPLAGLWRLLRGAAGGAAPAAHLGYKRLRVHGRSRGFYFHAPTPQAGARMPLVIGFHGGQGNGLKMARLTGLADVGRREGFAVAFPNADGYWQDGRSTIGSGQADVDFVRQIIAYLVKEQGVDVHRVYATGASNGGMFTLRLACEMSDEIIAFAPVIASFPATYWRRCQPRRARPILMINGTADAFIPWRGGAIRRGRRRGAGGEVIPVPQTVEFWRRRNACAGEAKVYAFPNLRKEAGIDIKMIEYPGCHHGATVRLVRIEGGGHAWPGSPVRRPALVGRLLGRTSKELNASELIWDFFSRHAGRDPAPDMAEGCGDAGAEGASRHRWPRRI